MRRDSQRSPRLGRFLLAAVLAATTVGVVNNHTSAAAPPAELISVDPKGGPLAADGYSPSVSGDGNIVVFNAFAFSTISAYTVYIRNRGTGTTTTIPQLPAGVSATTGTTNGVVSRDGCHVAFWGYFSSLVAASFWRVFVWDRCAGTAPVAFASTATSSSPSPLSISADGRYIAYFYTPPSGLQSHIARIDATTAIESALTTSPFTTVDSIDISDDGKLVVIGGQLPLGGAASAEVVGWAPPCANTCTTDVISVGPSGQPMTGYSNSPSASADGRYVAFVSDSGDVLGAPAPSTQLYVRDRVGGFTRLVTDTPGQPMIPAGIGMNQPEISLDGTQIAVSEEDQFENSQVWVARSTSGYFNTAAFDLVSYGVSGAPVPNGASSPSMSSTGRYVAFSSSSNPELSGGTIVVLNTQTWMRLRPIQLTSTPSLDFGTVDIGSQSAPKNAVITNSSTAEVTIGSVATTGPFNITVNGCTGILASGASCTVTMVFQPTAAGPAASSLVVAGDGLSVTTSLTGIGRTPTGPTPGFLTIKPASASFGSGPIGTSFPAKKFVVSNPGQAAVTIASVSLNGDSADQFAIATNGCTGSLASGGTCTIQVSATVTRDGTLSATLDVLGTAGQSAHATLRLGGQFTPELKMNPGVVSAGQVTVAIGSGFPPNIDVQLAFEGEDPFTIVHTDGDGAFRFNYLLLRNGVRIGGRNVVALDQAQFSGVTAPLLIDLATYRPSGFSSPAITSGVRSLVTRGG